MTKEQATILEKYRTSMTNIDDMTEKEEKKEEEEKEPTLQEKLKKRLKKN